MKVKVCGITNVEDALLAERLGADAVGFIFYSQSKRYINPDKAGLIAQELSPFIVKVGVFVNETAEIINEIVKNIPLNLVQLHGEEEPEMIERISVSVIKSFRINSEFDFSIIEKYKNAAYLLDSRSQNGYGGTGEKFDWEMIPESIRGKIILAGGVSVQNIEEIIKNIQPSAVDLSSSLEKEPGKKDERKMKEFFNKINLIRSKQW